MMDEAYARQRTPAGPRPEYIPPKTYRRDAVIPGNPDLRKALENGPMTRDELVRHFQCSRSDVAKPIYSLIRSGEVIEEGDRISLLRRDLPSKPSEEPKCYPSTTPTQKIGSRPVSGAGMGMSEGDAGSLPPDAGSHDHRLQDLIQTARLSDVAIIREHDRQKEIDRGQALRDALSLIMAELPALLEDREKLRKLREVLG